MIGGRNRAVGIAPGYGMNGPGSKQSSRYCAWLRDGRSGFETEQSVLRLATGWMVRVRNRAVGIAPGYGMDGPGSKPFFLTRPDWTPDPPTQPRVQWVLGLFPEGKVAWNLHPPYPVPKLKKEHSCSFTPLLGIHGLFYGELYLYYHFARHNLNVVLGEATKLSVKPTSLVSYGICAFCLRPL